MNMSVEMNRKNTSD